MAYIATLGGLSPAGFDAKYIATIGGLSPAGYDNKHIATLGGLSPAGYDPSHVTASTGLSVEGYDAKYITAHPIISPWLYITPVGASVSNFGNQFGRETLWVGDKAIRNTDQSTSVAGVTQYAGGWLHIIGFDQQYAAMCDLGFDTFAEGPPESSFFPGHVVEAELTIRQLDTADADDVPWPMVEFRTKTINIPSIQSGHAAVGVPNVSNL